MRVWGRIPRGGIGQMVIGESSIGGNPQLGGLVQPVTGSPLFGTTAGIGEFIIGESAIGATIQVESGQAIGGNAEIGDGIGEFIIGESAIGGSPKYIWVAVETDANGNNDNVYITALLQCLLLNLNESPFYGDWGIPAHPSVIQQVFPDYYVSLIQQRFAPYFASLLITKLPSATPTYRVLITTHTGTQVEAIVPV